MLLDKNLDFQQQSKKLKQNNYKQTKQKKPALPVFLTLCIFYVNKNQKCANPVHSQTDLGLQIYLN
jgi:hypothetical protein